MWPWLCFSSVLVYIWVLVPSWSHHHGDVNIFTAALEFSTLVMSLLFLVLYRIDCFKVICYFSIVILCKRARVWLLRCTRVSHVILRHRVKLKQIHLLHAARPINVSYKRVDQSEEPGDRASVASFYLAKGLCWVFVFCVASWHGNFIIWWQHSDKKPNGDSVLLWPVSPLNTLRSKGEPVAVLV